MLDPTPIRQRKRLWALGLGVGTLMVALLLSTRGLDDSVPPIAGVLGLVFAIMTGGLIAAGYLLAGVGLGALLVRLILPQSGHKPWISLAIGPGLMLFVSHGLGVLGLLSGARAQWVAIGTVILGGLLFGLMLWLAVRDRPNLPKPPATGLLWILPAALTLVAASNPPGWLWQSEASGYDVLEYHLQLPQEWAAGQRIWPLKHNVYSLLPNYVESGYTHIAAILGANRSGARPGESTGLLAYDGAGAMGCQLLHAGFGLIAAVTLSRVVWVLLKRAGLSGRIPSEVGALAGSVLLALPWVVVVSSMAYDESAVNALFAAALLIAVDSESPAGRRGIFCGLAVGLATACKPTAAFLVAPGAGLLLLAGLPPRAWFRAAVCGSFSGIVAIAPFLLRNWMACGNPIFPAGTAWFGPAHWSAEQITRFAGAHTEPADLAGRIALLFATTGTSLGGEARGIFHSQWMGLFPVGTIACVIAATWKPLRVPAILLALGVLAGLAWWIGFSHCQSRFLVPLAVPLAVATGLGIGRLAARWADGMEPSLQRLAMIVVGSLPLLLAAAATQRFFTEGGGRPNRLLPEGTSLFAGDHIPEDLRARAESERAGIVDTLGPEAFINNFFDATLRPGEKIYLIGGATPLYLRGGASGRVIYSTTYDASILGNAIRALPRQPELWADHLRAKGIEYVLVDFSEVARLSRFGWCDPDLTLEALAQWVQLYCQPVREWHVGENVHVMPERGLYRIRMPGSKERSS